MSISQTATQVRSRLLVAQIGQLADAGNWLNAVSTMVNQSPQADQVSTVTVDTVTNSATYTFTVEGTDVSYTADSSATAAEISAGLLAAFNDNPGARAFATGVNTSSTVLTFTGINPGVAFSISDSDAKLTTATTTAAAEADPVEFGRALLNTGFADGDATQSATTVQSSLLTAQVDTLTVTYAASEVYYITITIEGQPYTVGVAADTNTATTQAAIIAAINAMMPANTVLAAGSSPDVTLTAEVAGKAFTVGIGLKSGTASRLTLAHTTATLATDLNASFVGISLYDVNVPAITPGSSDVSYQPNSSMKVAGKGCRVWVENAESPSFGDPVYVETSTSSGYEGMFYKTTSATRIKLNNARWIQTSYSGSDVDLAMIELT